MALPTYRAALIIFSILLCLMSCTTYEQEYDGFTPISKVFNEDFEVVWRASQLAFQKYPMRINNIDKGLLETDWIKGNEIWRPPYASKIKPSGLRYKITLRTIKGKSQGDSAIKVSLQKTIEKKRDFFSDIEKPPSDGMEEKSLLYRVEREIQR